MKLKTEWHMTDLPKITSFSVLKKMVRENKKIDSDPMRLFVLLLYETSICSEPNWISWLTHKLLTLYTACLGVEPHCHLPSLLFQWSYWERNVHAILCKNRDVCWQMHGESILQLIALKAEHVFKKCVTLHIFWVLLNDSASLMGLLFLLFIFEITRKPLFSYYVLPNRG